jgi:putative ABC transport system permease protein
MSRGSSLFALTEGVVIAVDALRANKVRAALTILGIAVGVFVVVIISAAVHGINESVAKDFESTGPTSFFLQRFPISFEACDGSDDTCKWRLNPAITMTDIEAIQRLPSVEAVGAQIQTFLPVTYRGVALSGPEIDGMTANWPSLGSGDIVQGRSFTPSEATNGDRVVVLNENAAERLFGGLDPLDKKISIGGVAFQVIGIYRYTASFLTGGDAAKFIVPIETARRALAASPRYLGAVIRPRPNVLRDDAMDDVIAQLRALRRLKPSVENNFALITQDQLFSVYNKIFGMFFAVMISLSAVGLLVGGVGVIAIMMISVTERTREIGVRKALGATRRNILWQFLVEAVTLTAIGAMVGLVAGWLVSVIIRHAFPIPASVPPTAIVMALGASVVTGIAFGMLPALRAARLDPVEALRYE